ncbi:terminase small subunit [Deinococcus peraridilitoris]|uniref:Phage terminase, small subunit n=1 Tax=Deinococcus peraridilitoris (strain DSM 19664 / LMG 22246 / CIP 109416 / KR-200) TaxID=937777 RepID=K9ZZA1_DEIPD|nr:terminase small subunit [Deinococcus peraridilitoris]AFZ66080.1 phage terminase, small subunit [Deinococcus peraridilitoris DSM 19664]
MTNTPKLDALNPRHKKFVLAYCETLNDSEAARAAGYADRREGWRLRQREDIGAAISEILEDFVMGKTELLARLSRDARADMRDFTHVSPVSREFWTPARTHPEVRELAASRKLHVDDLDDYDLEGHFGAERVAHTADGVRLIREHVIESEVVIDWQKIEERGQLSVIKKLKKAKDGSVEFELVDAVRAKELIGRHHKLFTDKVEHSGDVGLVIGIDVIPPEGVRDDA